MNKFKKTAVIILSVIMLIAATGCGGFFGGPSDDTPKFGEDGGNQDPNVDLGHLTISVFGIEMDTLQAANAETKKIMDVIEDKFDVTFNILSGSPSSWKQQLNQYIGGGDIPDVFFHTMDEPSYSTWLKEGYLFNFSNYFKDYPDLYPNLKNAFERYPKEELKFMLGGDYFSYPVVTQTWNDSSIINEHAMYYRRDWYENLKNKDWKPSSGRDLVDPEDPDFNYLNFFDLCEGFTNGDPDNNAASSTYGYAMHKEGGVWWWYPLLSMFNVMTDGWYQNSSGKWMPEVISDRMKEAVWFIADMYDRGFINSNYATTMTKEMMKNDFVNGVAGIMVFNATYPTGQSILDLMQTFATGGKEISDVVGAIPVITTKDGDKSIFAYTNNYGYNAINNNLSRNKKKRILAIMEYMLSEEGRMLLDYGIENVHYRIDNDEIVSLLGADKYGYPKMLYHETVAPGVFRLKGLVSWSTPISTSIRHYDEQLKLLTAWGASEYLTLPRLSYVSVDPSFGLKRATLDESVAVAFKSIVANVGSNKESKRNETWNNFVSKYKRDGDAYIVEKNSRAKQLYD